MSLPDGIPTKIFFMGEDVETLPRERLIEIIRHLGCEVESAHSVTRTIIDMNRSFDEARAARAVYAV